MRQYAIKKGFFDKNDNLHHDATVYDDEFDRQVDYQARKTLQEKQGNVLDSWLSGFMAQGVDQVLKVLVFCSEDAVRVDRIMNRDKVDLATAKKNIFDRETKNLTKWQRMYKKQWQEWVVSKNPFFENKDIYFWYPQMYDLVLDTYELNPIQTLEQKRARKPEHAPCQHHFELLGFHIQASDYGCGAFSQLTAGSLHDSYGHSIAR